jgi:hypothetical protein
MSNHSDRESLNCPDCDSYCEGSADSSQNHHPGCDSDCESYVAPSYGSQVSDCRKRPRTIQIKGAAWVLCGQITVDDLNTLSHSTVAGLEDNVENEGEILKIHSHLQILFGAHFEKLFGKMHGNVKYFVVFCNVVNILDVGADTSNHAKEVVKIEIQGFLQLRNAVADTALKKLLPLFAPHLSGCWERCVGGRSRTRGRSCGGRAADIS